MSMSYLLADMFTRIRNGQMASHASVRCPASNYLENVLKVLEDEGYIRGYTREEIAPGKADLKIDLKYHDGEAVIRELKTISKPGRRVYASIKKMPRVHNGLGIAVLSTSKGVLSDYKARLENVGGEVLAYVF